MTPNGISVEQKQRAAAKELLENADETLAKVDASEFCKRWPMRDYPLFQESEIEIGPVLGIGGFCVVYEVEKFKLNDEISTTNEAKDPIEPEDDSTTPNTIPSSKHPLDDNESGEHHHYVASTARNLMANNVLRNGRDARYAIKRLDAEHLSELELARGMIDLAIETKFLSRLWHPNIGTCSNKLLKIY